MCPTPVGRIHTRVAVLVPGALLAILLSLITGRPDWIVLIGVFLLLGISLDTGIYAWAIRYQPPWMTFVLALVEFGLLLVLASILELDLTLIQAIVFYWVVWSMAAVTKVVVLPIASLTYLESAQEFRRIEWSVPDTQASVPILAAAGVGSGSGLFEQAAHERASSLARRPSPSGIHQAPVPARPGEPRPTAPLRLVEIRPQRGRELVVGDEISIGREGCDVSLDDAEVSRRHASLSRSGEGLRIADLGSSNGTYVNGKTIAEPRLLVAGDEVRVGEAAWKVERPAGEEAPEGVHGGQLTALRGSIAPPEPTPSGIRRFPGFDPEDLRPPGFPAQPASRQGASAARRLEATVISFGTVAITAVSVIAYLAAR